MSSATFDNYLYYGDNLQVLRDYIPDASVDLVYLDPPFNSNADYNVLFAEKDHTESAAQIRAFEDTWKWDSAAAEAFHQAVQSSHGRVPDVMNAFATFLGNSDMLAYLSMMAPRLIELHRVLNATDRLGFFLTPPSLARGTAVLLTHGVRRPWHSPTGTNQPSPTPPYGATRHRRQCYWGHD